MKKLAILLMVGLSFSKNGLSQTNELIAESKGGKLYLNHTVMPKENWYSVGRLFNISPKELAPFNGVTLEKPLVIGEEIMIPLTDANFSQNGQKSSEETFVALYHSTKENEILSHVSAGYNNVAINLLEKWNHLSNEKTKPGSLLIIGYLKVKPALSALAAGGKDNIPMANPSSKKAENQVTNHDVVSKEEKKKETVTDKPASIPKEDPKSSENINTRVVNHNPGSYFSAEYNEGAKSASGLAGVFKSTSGWQDGKYYALLNNAPVGTIIKIVSPATNKSVYAKVLGPLPDMKESAGLTIRISNAAASELGENDPRFNVEVRY
jgi:hypothetical protein